MFIAPFKCTIPLGRFLKVLFFANVVPPALL